MELLRIYQNYKYTRCKNELRKLTPLELENKKHKEQDKQQYSTIILDIFATFGVAYAIYGILLGSIFLPVFLGFSSLALTVYDVTAFLKMESIGIVNIISTIQNERAAKEEIEKLRMQEQSSLNVGYSGIPFTEYHLESLEDLFPKEKIKSFNYGTLSKPVKVKKLGERPHI